MLKILSVCGVCLLTMLSSLLGPGIKFHTTNTVVATITWDKKKHLISPINLVQIPNPGTVLKSARPEDFKTVPECWNWPSFGWDIWGFRQMVSFSKFPVKW